MKRFSIEITDAASTDIQRAVEWYDEIAPIHGNRFLADLTKVFNSLSINPYFQIRHGFYRCIRLKKFPFLVHFVVLEDAKIVKVAAVLHTSRNPEIWPEDLG